MNHSELTWPHESICIRSSVPDITSIAADTYNRTCRTDFSSPGFCVINFGADVESVAFRQSMINLKRAMAEIHQSETGKTLIYVSAARFDQQETTRPHLDAGPDECFLMLGYEPSEVEAELEISDYSKCAYDHGLTPKAFMTKHNPMFQAGYEMLRPYSTRIPCFSSSDFQIVCINNSSAPYSDTNANWQGTLHTARILKPDESKRRIINSTMIASASASAADLVDESQQQDFINTTVVRRRGYDKLHLDDDS